MSTSVDAAASPSRGSSRAARAATLGAVRRRRALVLLLLLTGLVVGGGGAALWLAADGASAPPTRDAIADSAADAAPRARARVHTTSDAGTAPPPSAAPVAAPSPSSSAAADATPSPAARRVGGRVLDGSGGRPLVDARVRVVVVADGSVSWEGCRTGEGGVFEASVPGDAARPGARIELRIARRGHRTLVLPWTDGPVEVRLEPLDHAPLPGRVVGFATDAAGHVLSGRLLLDATDEFDDHAGLWALADDAGRFVLEGVPAGWWRLRLVGGDATVPAIVPEDGETRVALRGGAEPWPGALGDDEFARRHAELSARMAPERATTDAQLGAAEEREAALAVALAVQDLEQRRRATAPTREVEIRGLPSGASVHLRADAVQGPQDAWRARVVEGVARFPALTHEAWRLVLEVPGDAEVRKPLDVVAGEGVLCVDW